MTTRNLTILILITGVMAVVFLGHDHKRVDADNSNPVRGAQSPADRIQQALAVRDAWNFDDVPLEVAIKKISRQFNIPIWIDQQELENVGVDLNSQIKFQLSDVSLETSLRLMLEPLQCVAVVQNDVLRITSKDKSIDLMEVRVYPVRDLIDEPDVDDYGSLMETIHTVIHSDVVKWGNVDGEGGEVAPLPNAMSLSIRTTWQGHRQIEGLLTALRQAKRLQGIPSLPIDPTSTKVLLPVMPAGFTQSIPTEPTSSSSVRWQQPRIHLE